MYLPLASVVVLVVTGIDALIGARGFRRARSTTAVAVVVVVFSAMTMSRNHAYASAEQLWGDTIAKRPANARAQTNVATPLLRSGRYAEAEEHLRIAVREQPDLAEAQADLGVALCGQGKFDEGIDHLQRAIAIAPSYAAAHHDLAEAYASRGRLREAEVHYTAALDVEPENVVLLNRAAWILATAADEETRNGPRAIDLAQRAVRLTGHKDATSLDTLAAAQAEVGRFDDAAQTGEAALALARANGEGALVAELEQRLALYRRREKIRQ
jgi:tetratricopeptide (TPR) repeat protein